MTAVVLAVLTGVYVLETRRLVRAQTHPNVVVFTDSDRSRPTIIQIVIRNIGHAVAREVTFSLSEVPPSGAFHVPTETKPAVPMHHGPLIEGIPALGPGTERRIDWGQYHGLKAALGGRSIYVTCHFVHGEKRLAPTYGILEVESFAATIAHHEPITRIAKALEAIERYLAPRSVGVEATDDPPEEVNGRADP